MQLDYMSEYSTLTLSYVKKRRHRSLRSEGNNNPLQYLENHILVAQFDEYITDLDIKLVRNIFSAKKALSCSLILIRAIKGNTSWKVRGILSNC